MNEQMNQQNNVQMPPNWNVPVSAPPWWMMNLWQYYGMMNGQKIQNQSNVQMPSDIQSINQGGLNNVTQQNSTNEHPNREMITCGIISDESEIKPADIPMTGGFGMFMQKDLSAIYIKQWQSDGKIYTKKYVESIEEIPVDKNDGVTAKAIFEQTNARFEKIEDALSKLSYTLTTMLTQPKNSSTKKNSKTEALIDE